MREKSELERYVRGMMIGLRFQKLRRSDEWVNWTSCFIFALLLGSGNALPAAIFCIVATVAQVVWLRRRLAADPQRAMTRTLTDSAIRKANRQLKRGTYDAKVGPEARAILESCAASANGIVAAAAGAHFTNGGKPVVMESYREISRLLDTLMKEALVRADVATIMDRLPDEAALADLRAIEARLAGLQDEAKRLALEFRPVRVDALPTEWEDARGELDQGA